jgi:hypothetical protein
MRTYLTDKYAGYVAPEKMFKNVEAKASNATEYLIQTSFEKNDILEQLQKTKNCLLIKRFEKNYCFSEIYKVANDQ